MTSIFNPHFWHHVWSRWSDPVPGSRNYPDGTKVQTQVQTRKCQVCGKVEARTLAD